MMINNNYKNLKKIVIQILILISMTSKIILFNLYKSKHLKILQKKIRKIRKKIRKIKLIKKAI